MSADRPTAPGEAQAPAPSRRRGPLLALAILLCIPALTYSAAPVLTLVNDGLVVSPRADAWLSALGPALCWLALACLRRSRAQTAAGLALAVVFAGLSLDRGLDRVRLDGSGISQRGLFGTAALAWSEVTRVDTGTARLIAWAGDERQVSIPIERWTPEQRATLERAIARRVREATATAAPR
jgi:hypothetical protein